jgi:hypothetical protein
MKEANSLIRRHLETSPRWHYADTAAPMLGDDGRPKPELFVKDGLHLSDQGYALWTGIVRPLLAKSTGANASEKK